MTLQLDPYEQSYPPALWAPPTPPAGSGTGTASGTKPAAGGGGTTPTADADVPDAGWLVGDISDWLADATGRPTEYGTKKQLLERVQEVVDGG